MCHIQESTKCRPRQQCSSADALAYFRLQMFAGISPSKCATTSCMKIDWTKDEPPSRCQLATWVMKAWEKVPDDLIKKWFVVFPTQ